MIVTHPSPRRLASFAGGGLALGVACLGLVRAGSPPLDPASKQAEDIVVERPAPLPAWRVQIDAALAERIATIEFDQADPVEAFQIVGTVTGLPIRVNEAAILDRGFDDVELEISNASGAELLHLLCLQMDGIGWSVAGGKVHVGDAWDLPDEIDLRFYRIADVLEVCGVDHASALEAFVMEYGLSGADNPRLRDAWEQEGWTLDTWRGLLAVRATEDGHRSIRATLGRALARAERPAPRNEPWRAALEARLSEPFTAAWADVPCAEALRELSAALGVPVLYVDGDPEDGGQAYDHEPSSATLGAVLRRIAEGEDRHVTLRFGAVVLAEEPDMETHLHPVEELLALDPESPDRLFDEIVSFVQNVDPHTWDSSPWCTTSQLGNVLVVRQSPETQERIRALLAQMKRALGGQ